MNLGNLRVASFLRPLKPLAQRPTAEIPIEPGLNSVRPNQYGLHSLGLNPLTAPTPTGGAAPATGTLATYSTQLQQQTQWCWAAIGASAAAFFGVAAFTTQCAVADSVLALSCCSADPANVGGVAGAGGCNNSWALDDALTTIGHFGRPRLDATVQYQDLCDEIDAQRPVGVRIKWKGTTTAAHYVAVIGYGVINDENWVDVGDPGHGFVQVKYDDLVSAYGTGGTLGDWKNTYYTNASKPAGGSLAPPVAGPTASPSGPVAP